MSYRYFLLNKPYDMLSQFIGGQGRMLGELDYGFPEGGARKTPHGSRP